MVVKGWVTFLQPIAISLGAALTAFNLDLDIIPEIQPITWKNFFSKDKDQVRDNNTLMFGEKDLQMEKLLKESKVDVDLLREIYNVTGTDEEVHA